jgi:sugar lactone lactonase YvrE
MQPLDGIGFSGSGLKRPECVLAHASGVLIVPDWTDGGGVSLILPDGRTVRHLARDRTAADPLRPNGIALEDGGTVLMAHLGDETGGVFRLKPDGSTEPVITELGGAPLPPCNFVISDGAGGLWLTVSTRRVPRALGYRKDVDDGFIVHIAPDGSARIAADGLGYTNECMVHPSAKWLYVNETFVCRLSRFDLLGAGKLGPRQTVCEFGSGTFPDGLAFDIEGNAWVTSIVSNRVVRVAADGSQTIWLEDVDPQHLAWVEQAYQRDEMGRPHLDRAVSLKLSSISNVAFGGIGRKTGYLGCLLGERIAHFPMPVAGHPLPHWNVDIRPLLAAKGLEP